MCVNKVQSGKQFYSARSFILHVTFHHLCFLCTPAFTSTLSLKHSILPSALSLVPRHSLFYAPEKGRGGGSPSLYFFTMSAPQAAHATSTCPLMLLDQEQVVNIVQFEGFSNAGCTLCFAKQKDCVSKCP